MKRTLKYALASVLGVAMVAPAFAQDNFPDVPENHWAFEALARLKAAGILVGYPDGLYRGGRPASRYEMAVALNAAYQNLKNMNDGLASQIADLKRQLSGIQPGGDNRPILDRLTALENQVNGMKAWGDDIANLKRMADTFQRELQSLGVDVEAMKRDLADLADRVAKLEAHKPAIDFGGDANLWMGAGNSRGNNFGLDVDGRINGSLNGGGVGSAPVGLTADFSILHEVALTLKGTNDSGPKWKGTVVVGNMLGAGFGSLSGGMMGAGYTDRGAEDVYINDFSVKFDTSIAGLGFNAEVGRVGYKVSKYMFQRQDTTSYMKNDRWDNGMYYFDGAILGFHFGGSKLDVFGGNTTFRNSVNGVDMNPVVSGPIGGMFAGPGGTPGPSLAADRTLGVNFNVPLTANGNLNLAYLFLARSTPVMTANRLNVFGGSADFAFGDLKLEGGYSKAELTRNTTTVNNSNNTAWYVKGSWSNGEKFGLYAGYREVEANYVAPGDWGRLGIIRNPANIKGFNVGGHLNVNEKLTIKASGEFNKGKSNTFAATTGFNTGTKIDKLAVGLNYKMNESWNLMLGYEDTQFKGMNAMPGIVLAGNPRYTWTTFGLGYGLSDHAKLTFQYQLSDVKNEFVLRNGTQRYTGGFLTTQLSLKF